MSSNLMHSYCSLPPRPDRWANLSAAELGHERLSLVQKFSSRWALNTKITWAMQGGSLADRQEVVRAAATWQSLIGGLQLVQVNTWEEAMVRIGFGNDGSWSYVGPDCLHIPKNEPTMEFGWSLATTWGKETALHEWGHALGAWHEHQNPRSGIVWDEAAVLAYFGGPPNNWSADMIQRNILTPLRLADTDGSAWDKDSIMHYPFEAGLITEPAYYRTHPLEPALGLSSLDKARMQLWYPGRTEPTSPSTTALPRGSESVLVSTGSGAAGKQYRFRVDVKAGECFKVETTGDADTLLVLLDMNENQVAADNDAGTGANAMIKRWQRTAESFFLDMRISWHDGKVTIKRA